jgi:hypothetical protein
MSLRAFLPGSEELPSWTREGESQYFSGEDLFTYIDGGAEIYFEFGFQGVVVQDYLTDAGGRLSLEIFEMTTPDGAYGMFTFKRSRHGDPVSLGDQCQLADYYLNLLMGPYLVTITALDPGEDAKKEILSLARTIEPRIGLSAAPPNLVSCLPAEGLDARSIKYFKGALSLYNDYPFFHNDVFAFSAGVKGEYDRGYSLYIFEYPDGPAARRRFDEAGKRFKQIEKYRDFAEKQGIYQLKDEKDNRIFAAAKGKYILVLIGHEDGLDAADIFLLIDQDPADS